LDLKNFELHLIDSFRLEHGQYQIGKLYRSFDIHIFHKKNIKFPSLHFVLLGQL
jgi:hypothetical protein